MFEVNDIAEIRVSKRSLIEVHGATGLTEACVEFMSFDKLTVVLVEESSAWFMEESWMVESADAKVNEGLQYYAIPERDLIPTH